VDCGAPACARALPFNNPNFLPYESLPFYPNPAAISAMVETLIAALSWLLTVGLIAGIGVWH
jgi:hypothetical protein